MSFEILTPQDARWEALFERLPVARQDVFYASSFARLCQSTLNTADEVRCAAMSDGTEVILYPFVRRNVGRLSGRPDSNDLYDVISLYGRGGVVASRAAPADLQKFYAALGDYCQSGRVICGFDRFHPVIGNDAWGAGHTRIIDVGGFVVVDLRPDFEAIEQSFKPSVRKDVRKAERNGIECFSEGTIDHLQEFLDIYYHTMGRNSASGFYYFTREYFELLAREMPGRFQYFYARKGEEIVSCELVLHHGKYGHSFLGGTKREALHLSANPMLKREIIRSLKEWGVEHFLLGGGTRPNDGIFEFKRAYAPAGVLPSRVGGTIWDTAAYQDLKEQMSTVDGFNGNRFQFYDRG
jgi:Acetyltransferase (GNAT) domain